MYSGTPSLINHRGTFLICAKFSNTTSEFPTLLDSHHSLIPSVTLGHWTILYTELSILCCSSLGWLLANIDFVVLQPALLQPFHFESKRGLWAGLYRTDDGLSIERTAIGAWLGASMSFCRRRRTTLC